MTVEIFEVGPRDGLQNEARPISVADKIKLVDLLSCAGFRRIECASFVSPKWVPQMEGSADVLRGIRRWPGVSYAALTPNVRGLNDAIAASADEVAIFASASEGFSQANINASIEDSLMRYADVAQAAKDAGKPVRGYVSCVTDCPYDGPTAPKAVARVARALFDMGCYEVSLGDTIGAATPDSLAAMLRAVLEEAEPAALAGHYHDTGGRALENIDVSLEMGLRTFDAAVAGLGGCPYAPDAPGNVATEAVHAHVVSRGHYVDLNAAIVAKAARFARTLTGGTDVQHPDA